MVGQAVDERQFEHSPLVGTQASHHDANPFGLLLKLESLCARLGNPRRLVVQRRRVNGSTAFAVPIDQPPLGDGGDKGRLGRQLRVKPRGTAPNLQQRLLNGIFRIGVTGRMASGERPDQIPVLIQAFVHRLSIAGRNSLEDGERHEIALRNYDADPGAES